MINSRFDSRDDIMKFAYDKGFKIGAEIGVSKGQFSEIICKIIPDVTLYCIDPYLEYRGNGRQGNQETHDAHYKEAKVRLYPYNVTIIRETSMDAVKNFDNESLDFVFIDGNHSFDYIMQDIIEWSKKVKKGGIVSGHDYYNFGNSGVVEAVDIYSKWHKKDLQLTKGLGSYRDDRVPSWWWIK